MSAYAPYVVIAASAFLGVVIPWSTVRMLSPALESGRLVSNYRGRPVHSGLGVAWLVWAGAAMVGNLIEAFIADVGYLSVLVPWFLGPLAFVACALGMFDDAYGTGSSRGFRGHLSELTKGRMTTGGLKLIGISAASLMVAMAVFPVSNWGNVTSSPWLTPLLLVTAGAAVALTANLVNLTDLRPGRASKTYLLLAAGGVVSVVYGLDAEPPEAYEVISLVLFLIGPVVATWGPDLGERGMLGDAGANAAGAVAGVLIVIGLPWWGLVAYLAAVFALNLLSERISFSKVIEGNALLSAIDRLGRLRGEEAA